MSWCDKLASVPSVGIAYEPLYATSASVLDALAPLLADWAQRNADDVIIDKVAPFSAEIGVQDGLFHGFEPTKLFVDFRFRGKLKPVSGGYPTLEMLSKPAPFSELLQVVSRRLIEVFERINQKDERSIMRLGVVTSTQVAPEDLPPGIRKFIDYVSKPWPKGVTDMDFRTNGVVDSSSHWNDKCIHHIVVPVKEEDLLTVRFDYQRTFVKPSNLKANELQRALNEVAESASAYFEELGIGDRFDVEHQ